MQDFKKYIVPFVDNEAMGCGFFIRDYFITAGHMFDEAKTHAIYYNGAYHTFNRADAVFLKSFKDGASDVETQDIAIFKFEGVDSPLRFSDKIPSANTALTNISFIPVSNCINPFDTLITDCIVTRLLFNFFECKTSNILKRGSSGSPLIIDNIVYGILSGCLDDVNHPDSILFCSTLNLPQL